MANSVTHAVYREKCSHCQRKQPAGYSWYSDGRGHIFCEACMELAVAFLTRLRPPTQESQESVDGATPTAAEWTERLRDIALLPERERRDALYSLISIGIHHGNYHG
jgi:hypothetical protein